VFPVADLAAPYAPELSGIAGCGDWMVIMSGHGLELEAFGAKFPELPDRRQIWKTKN
jgi:hypothetical protein